MVNPKSPTPETTPPQLWNPNAAANWSILFTPAFGAYLHAANWRALGKPDRARTNMVWFWATIVFLIFILGSVVLPQTKHSEDAQRMVGAGLLLGWYFSQGRPQVQFVKETYSKGYVKKPWGPPMLIAISCFLGYFAVCVLLFALTDQSDPEELAAETKQVILKEWKSKPG